MSYWSVKKVAEYLGVSRGAIYNYIQRDLTFPPPVKIGGCLKFDSDDILKYLEKRKQTQWDKRVAHLAEKENCAK